MNIEIRLVTGIVTDLYESLAQSDHSVGALGWDRTEAGGRPMEADRLAIEGSERGLVRGPSPESCTQWTPVKSGWNDGSWR